MPDEKLEGQEEKVDELTILCEIPLKISVGERKFLVRPLTLKQLRLLQEPIKPIAISLLESQELLTKAAVGISKIKPKDVIDLVLKNVNQASDKIIEALQIVLVPADENGKPEAVILEEIDMVELGKIIGFLVKTTNLGEAVKNVRILRSTVA